MSAQDGLLVSSHPSRCVSTIRRTRGSPISGTDSGGGDPDVQTLTFHQAPTGSASTVSCSPPRSPQPTRRPPRASGSQGPPGGGNSAPAGPCLRRSGSDSMPPPTRTHISVADVTAATILLPPRGGAYLTEGTVNLKVVPSRVLEATQIRPPNDRSTTSRHR